RFSGADVRDAMQMSLPGRTAAHSQASARAQSANARSHPQRGILAAARCARARHAGNMSTAAMRTAPIDPLEIGVRRIRRVEPPDGPCPAARAVIGDGDPVLLVDALELAEWPGWRATGAQHLLAPVDVLRRSDGHDAVISDLREPCTRTV